MKKELTIKTDIISSLKLHKILKDAFRGDTDISFVLLHESNRSSISPEILIAIVGLSSAVLSAFITGLFSFLEKRTESEDVKSKIVLTLGSAEDPSIHVEIPKDINMEQVLLLAERLKKINAPVLEIRNERDNP